MNSLTKYGRIALLGFVITLFGCNTYFWQPVDKLIVGTWIRSPNPMSIECVGCGFLQGQTTSDVYTERWIFGPDGIVNVELEDNVTKVKSMVNFVNCTSGSTTLSPNIDYSVKSSITKHHVIMDGWFCGGNSDLKNLDIGQFLVVEISKDKLYLSSEIENSEGVMTRGSFQRGFIRE